MRTLPTLSLFVLASACAVACTASTNDPAPLSDDDASSVQSALEAENGGMSMDDEKPAFGDPEVDALEPEQPAPAEIADAPGADLPTMRSYRVALVWGHLPPAADASASEPDPAPIEWNGSVSVDKGAIGVKRTIAFDGRDHLERRDDKAEVSFVSHTLPHVDGLFLHVVVPADAPQTLHFASNAATFDLDLGALAKDGFSAHRLGDGRNGVAVAGYADVTGCARGFVAGRWIKTQPALGRFRGRVVNGDAELIGHVRGIWGHAPKKDKNVFFGKYIATDGKTRGLFGGGYGDGELRGLWGTVRPRDVGALEGVYSDGYAKDDGRGTWIARWSERCE